MAQHKKACHTFKRLFSKYCNIKLLWNRKKIHYRQSL